MANQPLVSIVVPVFNGERFLHESLDSIVAQTYRDVEILVMDDASTDGTPEILRSYGDRIRVNRQEKNRGQFQNVTDGIAIATGKYVAVYHADDVYMPTIVEREAAFLDAHPDVGAVFALDIMIDAEGRERGRGRVELPKEIPANVPLQYPAVLNALLLHKNRIFRAPSSMVRASIYRDLGAYRGSEYPVAADFEMFLRVARYAPVAILGEHLFKYRWGHGNADQIDRLGRLGPEPYFAIMEEHLSSGGAALAHKGSLAAHTAHLVEDKLMRCVNHYILGKPDRGLPLLRTIELRTLIGSGKVQRARLVLLYALLRILLSLPRSPLVAAMFYRRWYSPLARLHLANLEDPLPWLAERGYASTTRSA